MKICILNTKFREAPHHDLQIAVCKSDAAWDASRLRAGLAWTISGSPEPIKRREASIQNFVTSPLIAEALAVREGLYMAANQGISNLWLCSDNSHWSIHQQDTEEGTAWNHQGYP
ncbi:hypothetical protein Bca101_019335 [Brassica carinata]